jgi:hypothetical protein
VIQTMKREMTNTITRWIQGLSGWARSVMIPCTVLAISATTGAYPGVAQQPPQQTFASATEASQNLFQAVQSNNLQAIANILGGPTNLTSCGDAAQDKADRELFVQKYQQMHRLGREADGSVALYIGAENWPFPIPLIEKGGAWRFDPDTGQKEVLFRRIGENELTAITICREFVAAEKQHHAKANTANPADSLPESLTAQAAGESAGGDPVLLHGYHFRILAIGQNNATRPATGGKATGRFALVAYPAEYRSSGVMTFVVTKNGVVYEKDLGVNTSTLASAMTKFHKDPTWQAASE